MDDTAGTQERQDGPTDGGAPRDQIAQDATANEVPGGQIAQDATTNNDAQGDQTSEDTSMTDSTDEASGDQTVPGTPTSSSPGVIAGSPKGWQLKKRSTRVVKWRYCSMCTKKYTGNSALREHWFPAHFHNRGSKTWYSHRDNILGKGQKYRKWYKLRDGTLMNDNYMIPPARKQHPTTGATAVPGASDTDPTMAVITGNTVSLGRNSQMSATLTHPDGLDQAGVVIVQYTGDTAPSILLQQRQPATDAITAESTGSASPTDSNSSPIGTPLSTDRETFEEYNDGLNGVDSENEGDEMEDGDEMDVDAENNE